MTDFHFLFGRWKVHNTRLAERLVGSSTWIEFDAVSECRPILGGIGNVDEMVTSWNGRYRGMSLRLFDLERKTWSIYWSSSLTGVLDPPVTGTFADNIG